MIADDIRSKLATGVTFDMIFEQLRIDGLPEEDRRAITIAVYGIASNTPGADAMLNAYWSF